MTKLVCAAALLALAAAPVRADDARATIEKSNRAFQDAVARKDAKAMTASYGEDALLMPPNRPEAKGPAAIEEVWKSFFQQGLERIALTIRDVTTQGDLAVETGTFHVWGTAGGKKFEDSGKYLITWKSANGRWQIWRDIWNSDNPPAPPAATTASK